MKNHMGYFLEILECSYSMMIFPKLIKVLRSTEMWKFGVENYIYVLEIDEKFSKIESETLYRPNILRRRNRGGRGMSVASFFVVAKIEI